MYPFQLKVLAITVIRSILKRSQFPYFDTETIHSADIGCMNYFELRKNTRAEQGLCTLFTYIQ